MQKVLVTGATGFLGKAVCNALQKQEIPYVGAVRQQPRENQCWVGDLTGQTSWQEALRGCDVIIHLAARVHVMKEDASGIDSLYRRENVEATINLAQQAVAMGIKRFVFVSSVKVNGEATDIRPFGPYDNPEPLDPYGKSKLEAERALRELSERTGMEVVIVRPPLIYGPGVRANFLRLMQAIANNVPLPLRNISNLRSLAAIDNVVDLLILCASHHKAAGEIFMVSDDNDISISELVHMIALAMEKTPLLFSMPTQFVRFCAAAIGKKGIADRLFGSLQVDISHTKECLNWHPIISTEAAVEKTVSRFLAQTRSS